MPSHQPSGVMLNRFVDLLMCVFSGYTCIYKRRTGSRTDGCAVCYQSERFTQLSVNLLEFYRSDCQLLDRDNVGIVLLLQPITEQGEALSPICVANTHLLFNPRRGDVKLAQLAIVLAEIDVMMKKCKSQGRSCEVVLCGDFNALPNAPLLKFITGGQLYYHGLPVWMVRVMCKMSDCFSKVLIVSHPIRFRIYSLVCVDRFQVRWICRVSFITVGFSRRCGRTHSASMTTVSMRPVLTPGPAAQVCVAEAKGKLFNYQFNYF